MFNKKFNKKELRNYLEKISFIKRIKKDDIIIGITVIVIIILAFLISSQDFKFDFWTTGLSSEEIGRKVIDYINDNKLSPTPASLVAVSEESGLFKVKIKIGTKEFDSYATKDGRFLFPTAFEMVAIEDNRDNSQTASREEEKTAEEIKASIKKSDKPELEAFVVSRCPFGLQMQRMIYYAIKEIPELAKYVKVKYIGTVSPTGNTITSMHGEAEAKENLRQICIREEQPQKYWEYVGCQMKAGDTTSCETSTAINSAALNACLSDPNRGVAYAKNDFAAVDSYNVTGSPTLAINGAVIEEFTLNGQPVFSSSRSADEIREIVCEGFNNKPQFCSRKLNTKRAATSFSSGYENTSASSGTASSE